MPENEDDFTSDFNEPMRSRHNSLVKTSKSFVRRRNISLNLDLSGQGDEIDQNRSVSFENVAVGQTVAHEFCNGATVSESQVASEAERVVRSFMITAHQHYLFSLEDENFEGSSHSPFLALDISPIPELEYLDEDFLIAEDGTSPLSPTALVGRRLAQIGDELNVKYGDEFDNMARNIIRSLGVKFTIQAIYDAFSHVAMGIFQNGGITWGRIAALLTFGYRLILACFRIGYRFLNVSEVIQVVTKFIVTEQIAKWIARCGGWIAALSYTMNDTGVNLSSFAFIGLGCIIMIICLTVFSQRQPRL